MPADNSDPIGTDPVTSSGKSEEMEVENPDPPANLNRSLSPDFIDMVEESTGINDLINKIIILHYSMMGYLLQSPLLKLHLPTPLQKENQGNTLASTYSTYNARPAAYCKEDPKETVLHDIYFLSFGVKTRKILDRPSTDS